MKRIIVVAISVLLALSLAAPIAAGQTTSKDQTTDIGKSSATWWQWALQKEADLNPLSGSYSGGQKCAGASEQGVWNLGGSLSGEPVTRNCNVPAGQEILFPVANVVCIQEWDGETEAELRACAKGYIDQFLKGNATPYAKVDGKDVAYKRADSPFFKVTMPKNNIFYSLSKGELDFLYGSHGAVADGLWVKLPPLAKGQHKVEFGGEFGTGKFKFKQNNTYNLTVN